MTRWTLSADSARRASGRWKAWRALTVYPASELILGEAELKAGVDALTADAKKLYDAYRKEQKTEEAYRVKQAAEAVRTQRSTVKSGRRRVIFLIFIAIR